jgi:hypothetical protein
MDGYGTEGALVAIIMILAKIIWDQVKQRKAPGNPHNPLCVERKDQFDRLERRVASIEKMLADLRVQVAHLNGG